MLHLDPRYPPPDGERSVVRLLREYPFALVMSPEGGEPFFSHVPVVADAENDVVIGLRAHVARINPHVQRLTDGASAIVVFQGPNAYVSPTWYGSPAERAPTWNYAVVHVIGRLRLITDTHEVDRLLDDLAAIGETGRCPSWSPESYNPARRNALRPLILSFQIKIDRIDAKFKLNQHNSIADREGAIVGLSGESSDNSKAVAALMRESIDRVQNA